MTNYDYDLFVIGAGSGGVRAARISAQHGAKVAVAEEFRVGGTCVIRGCVPKKLLTYAAHFSDDFDDAAGYGWTIGDRKFSWPNFIANKDVEIDRLNQIYIKNLDAAGVEIYHSRAELLDKHTVRLLSENRTVTARTILIATGGAPNIDTGVSGHDHAISSNETFHLKEIPRSILITGGGFIALEFASIFHGLGVDTHVSYRGDKILRGFDGEIRDLVQASLISRGIKISCNSNLSGIVKTSENFNVSFDDGKSLAVDQVMMAIGRNPLSRKLGLEEIGVDINSRGAIAVDEYSRTSIENVYAVGDVTNRINLTPVAIREGHAVADNLFAGKDIRVDHSNVASAVFTTPEVGTVGLTEQEAIAQFTKIDVYVSTFRPMKNILANRDEKMMLKLVVCATSQKVLGCHIVGPAAAEMAQLVAIPIKMCATKDDFDATMAVHPTAAEELVTMHRPTRQHS